MMGIARNSSGAPDRRDRTGAPSWGSLCSPCVCVCVCRIITLVGSGNKGPAVDLQLKMVSRHPSSAGIHGAHGPPARRHFKGEQAGRHFVGPAQNERGETDGMLSIKS